MAAISRRARSPRLAQGWTAQAWAQGAAWAPGLAWMAARGRRSTTGTAGGVGASPGTISAVISCKRSCSASVERVRTRPHVPRSVARSTRHTTSIPRSAGRESRWVGSAGYSRCWRACKPSPLLQIVIGARPMVWLLAHTEQPCRVPRAAHERGGQRCGASFKAAQRDAHSDSPAIGFRGRQCVQSRRRSRAFQHAGQRGQALKEAQNILAALLAILDAHPFIRDLEDRIGLGLQFL